MAVIEATNYPINLFLCEDENGMTHWYKTDPMKTDALQREEIDLADEMLAFFGHGNMINPIIFQIKGAKINRAEPFRLSQLEDFRLGSAEEHLEDLEGHVVEILAARNANGGYPLNAVVLNRDGSMMEQRTYSSTGICSDGNDQHTLVSVKGPAVYDNAQEEAKPSGPAEPEEE